MKKVSHRGEVAEWSLNPLWTKVDRVTHEEFGLLHLFLVSRGRRLAVATFLGPAEKESFAAALTAAIGEAKRGPTRSVIPPPVGEGWSPKATGWGPARKMAPPPVRSLRSRHPPRFAGRDKAEIGWFAVAYRPK